MHSLRPGGFAAPEERGCRFVSNGFYRLVAAGFPAPTPGWLTLRAIRFTARVDGERHPIQALGSLSRPLAGLAAAVVTHAKQRVTSKGFFSFRMWKQARASLWASALIATTVFVLARLKVPGSN